MTISPHPSNEEKRCPQQTTPDTLSPADQRLQKLHAFLLVMLKDFTTLCERENLMWFGCFGTAIGALRHGGFIPWDDDLDICMPRKDLERITYLISHTYTDRYSVINAQLDKNYPLATTRIMLKGTEFRDASLASMNFESGIFLDLFPLDTLPDDDKLLRRQAWSAWLNNKLAIARATKNPYVAGNNLSATIMRLGAKGMRIILNMPGLRTIDFNERSLAAQTRYRQHTTNRIGHLCDTDRFAHIYSTEMLFPVRWVPFEDTHIPLAAQTEDILHAFYGDFMTPPPANLRHEHYPEILDYGPYETTGLTPLEFEQHTP